MMGSAHRGRDLVRLVNGPQRGQINPNTRATLVPRIRLDVPVAIPSADQPLRQIIGSLRVIEPLDRDPAFPVAVEPVPFPVRRLGHRRPIDRIRIADQIHITPDPDMLHAHQLRHVADMVEHVLDRHRLLQRA